MLQSLHIKNYVLIEELSIDFSSGLNIITGETGAGKSIILGALALLMGGRAETDSLLYKDKKCIVEAIFSFGQDELKAQFQTLDLDYDKQTVIRREINPNGKSRAFINDTPVNLSVLKPIGSKLIDIHSQHQNLLLNNPEFRLSIIDQKAGNEEILRSYQEIYEAYLSTKKQFESIKKRNQDLKREKDFIEFQYKQIEDLQLKGSDEQKELEAERDLLQHAEEIKLGFHQAGQLIDNDENSIIQQLKQAEVSLQNIEEYISSVKELSNRLQSSRIEIHDILDQISVEAEGIEVNPPRLEEINNRLDEIYHLLHKHQFTDLSELIRFRDQLSDQLLQITNIDYEEEKAAKKLEELNTELSKASHELSISRNSLIPDIENEIVELLVQLGIKQARFEIRNEELIEYSELGKDNIQFYFTATPKHNVQELMKVASGGEISRVMLSLKAINSSTKDRPTIIFDEIDTGVSGEIAHKFGKTIELIAKTNQVISITHLPQVAALGKFHYRVFKSDTDDSTQIELLSPTGRKTEIAKLLSGDELHKSALSHAESLLKNK